MTKILKTKAKEYLGGDIIGVRDLLNFYKIELIRE